METGSKVQVDESQHSPVEHDAPATSVQLPWSQHMLESSHSSSPSTTPLPHVPPIATHEPASQCLPLPQRVPSAKGLPLPCVTVLMQSLHGV